MANQNMPWPRHLQIGFGHLIGGIPCADHISVFKFEEGWCGEKLLSGMWPPLEWCWPAQAHDERRIFCSKTFRSCGSDW